MQEIKSLQEAEEIRKEYPYLYLIVVNAEGVGIVSYITCSKKPEPLYKVYFMVRDSYNTPDIKMSIINVIDITN